MLEMMDALGSWVFSGLVFLLLLYFAKEVLSGRKPLHDEVLSNRQRIFDMEIEVDKLKQIITKNIT